MKVVWPGVLVDLGYAVNSTTANISTVVGAVALMRRETDMPWRYIRVMAEP